MIRAIPFVVEIVLVVFCLVSLAQTPAQHVRVLPKVAWVFVVLLFPILGGLAYLIWGRPQYAARGGSGSSGNVPPQYDRPGRATASNPDDDAEFLRQVQQRAEEQRRKAEEERRRREQGGE